MSISVFHSSTFITLNISSSLLILKNGLFYSFAKRQETGKNIKGAVTASADATKYTVEADG
jgi:hypothetical protein